MYTASAPATEIGASSLAATAKAVAVGHGANGDIVGAAVRLLADDARARCRASAASATLTIEIAVDGTELVLTVRDPGEPVSRVAPAVLGLAEQGALTACEARSGIEGNHCEVRVPLPSHSRVMSDGVEVGPEADVVLSSAPVTMRPTEPGDAASFVRCLYRCYGWTYPGTDFYYPDRVAAAFASGRRIGEVALDPDGEVVAHWGALMVTDGLAETGAAFTDPRFRKRGIVNELGDRLLRRLVESGVRGRLREPVVTHTATQQIALREGAHLVGFLVSFLNPIEQIGITDGVQAERLSMTVMWSPLAEMTPSTVWIPPAYEPIVRAVLEPTDWPIEVGELRGVPDVSEQTRLSTSFEAHNRVGEIRVEVVGADLVDAVDDALSGLQRAGAEAIRVALPAAQQALARQGAGLVSLGLAFAMFVPDDGVSGDTLTLQWLRDAEVSTDGWKLASSHVERIATMIVDQLREGAASEVRLRRREARRQQLFASLPGGDA
ncbi:MAG: hypothetical protein RJB65_428 [Actinomycetota bacterium]